MSLDDAMTLRALATGERLEQERALTIIRSVVAALGEMHGAGKTHGSVSPETIFVAPRPGEDAVELRGAGAKGPKDPVYILAGLAEARTDLYAAGVVLFELLAGRPPFAADDAEGLRRLHAYGPRPTLVQRDPAGVFADDVEAVVATALAQQRDARFKDAKAMLEAIDRALAVVPRSTQGPVAAPPPGPGDPPKLPNVAGAAPPPLDPSLLLLAQDLMPAQDARPSEPVIADNAGREVPKLPWYTRAEIRLRRMPRKQLIGAGAGIIFLVVLVAMCSGGSKKKSASDAAAKPAPSVGLDAACEQLGKACGDNDKHAAKIIEDCKAAAAKQRDHGCEAKATAAYDCYEAKLCGAKKIWALDDLRVLTKRNNQCVAEANALHACGK